MKSNSKKILILIVLGMGFVFLPNIKLDFGESQKINDINLKASAGYLETFIHVDSNWSTTESIYDWCSGDGSWGNPYTIENVTIDATGSGILINNSKNDYFIIRNCTIFNAGLVYYDGGIKLENTNNGNLTNNNCSNNAKNGIILFNYCENNTISGNTANDNDNGIYFINDCDNNTISGNTANDNKIEGLGMYVACNFNNITGNTVNNNMRGIWFEENNDNTISGNTVNNNTDEGIVVYYECHNNTVSGNSVNNNGDSGIYLDDKCEYNTISGNIANNNTKNGIEVYDCDNNTISGNTANNNTEDGISLWNYSYNNTISGNTVNDNLENGIRLYNNCYNNTISGNTIDGNAKGIYMDSCFNNTILDNTISDNDEHGIYIDEDSHYQEITENIIYNNTIGIYIIGSSHNNLVYKNFFLKNGKHAIDEEVDTKWNSTTIGNYWDNHTDPDDNSDGIVDIQYNISGSAGSIDYLPIAEDGAPSIIINSPSGDDVFGTSAPSFSVTITDDFLDKWWYTLHEGLVNYNFTGSTGTIDQSAWDAFSDGTITLTFYASDIPGNNAWADVNIVKDTTAPIIVINSPSSEDEFGVTAPAFNIAITDDHLDSIWYSLDGGLTIYAIITNATIDQTAWAALSEGSITITFYANDTLGHETSKDVIITKSWDDPTIVIVVVSIVGGVAVITVVYVFMKKRATPE